MESNTNRLISGEEYTLSQLFQGEKKIVIPDLQRDYCWGDKADVGGKPTELVAKFVENLIDSFRNQEDLTLGLIYAYEHPHNHIQLCDGQQRLTTLFLILGMLNRETDQNIFSNILISDYELKSDDKEPYIQYAIRESTLYFLSDLTCNFFINGDHKIDSDDIRKQEWYFSEYDLDPSIKSMLAAIKTIEKYLIDVDYLMFNTYLLRKLKFLYYDMGTRLHGEETFVVINTTGEPLSATENLKPILISNIKNPDERKSSSYKWESWEKWFWENRNREIEQTSDEGLNDFFICYWQINYCRKSNGKTENHLKLVLWHCFQKSHI